MEVHFFTTPEVTNIIVEHIKWQVHFQLQYTAHGQIGVNGRNALELMVWLLNMEQGLVAGLRWRLEMVDCSAEEIPHHSPFPVPIPIPVVSQTVKLDWITIFQKLDLILNHDSSAVFWEFPT